MVTIYLGKMDPLWKLMFGSTSTNEALTFKSGILFKECRYEPQNDPRIVVVNLQ